MVFDSSSEEFIVDHESKEKEEIRFNQGKARADMNFILYSPIDKLYMKFEVPQSIDFLPLDRPTNSEYDRENKELRFESSVPSEFQFVVDLESESKPFSAHQRLEIYDFSSNKKIKKYILKT
ncbi:MAG: hypothetical protein ACOC4M_16785 [Promethearchaeia archaeon]